MITPVVSGTAGANGWYTSNVTVTWNVQDPESAATTGRRRHGHRRYAGTTFSCTSTSGGGTATASTGQARTVAPAVTCGAPRVRAGQFPPRSRRPSRTPPPARRAARPVARNTNTAGTFNATLTGTTGRACAPPGSAATRSAVPKCNGLTPTIVGTGANNTINGTSGRDVIVGPRRRRHDRRQGRRRRHLRRRRTGHGPRRRRQGLDRRRREQRRPQRRQRRRLPRRRPRVGQHPRRRRPRHVRQRRAADEQLRGVGADGQAAPRTRRRLTAENDHGRTSSDGRTLRDQRRFREGQAGRQDDSLLAWGDSVQVSKTTASEFTVEMPDWVEQPDGSFKRVTSAGPSSARSASTGRTGRSRCRPTRSRC